MTSVAELYINEGKDLMLKLINVKKHTGAAVKILIDDNDFQAFNGKDFYSMLMNDALEDGTPILSRLDKVVKEVESNISSEGDKKIYSAMYFFCSTHRSYFDEVETVYNTVNGYHSGRNSFERTKNSLKESYDAIVNSDHESYFTKCELAISNI